MMLLKKIWNRNKNFLIKEKKEKILFKKFYKDFEKYNTLASDNNKAFRENFYPCLYDATTETKIEPIYFFQDSWAFEMIFKNKPVKHVDIGSHHTFVAFLSKITDLTMVDIRPFSVQMDSIKFKEGDILHLPFENKSIDSLSSLCVIEHIGLGRYGDEIDPLGSEKALSEINRILKKDAHFYLSLPVSDKNIVRFNAGRIFCFNQLIENLSDYHYADMKFIIGNKLSDVFIPHDCFGTTILLDLIKNKRHEC